ncbi:hypothetical protein AAVH_36928, partial [Aphelenchoides avenae]
RVHMLESWAATTGGENLLIKGTVKRYKAAFEHLMFDRVYFDALRRRQLAGTTGDASYGTEQLRSDQTCPIVPAGLTASQRAQWIQDFTALSAYAQEHKLDAVAEKEPEAVAAHPLAASLPDAPAPPSKLDVQRKANQQAYEKNKKIALENAAMERKMDRMKAAFRALVAKIESKIGAKVAADDPTQRLPEAVKLLLMRTQNDDHDK